MRYLREEQSNKITQGNIVGIPGTENFVQIAQLACN
jgi:hypothetical protein|tara:strand:+ start:455 stop:562 length:108 start_codon:yes stop_codon:yes gene_type:complete